MTKILRQALIGQLGSSPYAIMMGFKLKDLFLILKFQIKRTLDL